MPKLYSYLFDKNKAKVKFQVQRLQEELLHFFCINKSNNPSLKRIIAILRWNYFI